MVDYGDFINRLRPDGGEHRSGGGTHRSGAPRDLPGMDPVLSGESLEHFLRDQSQQILDATRTSSMFSTMFMSQMKTTLDQMATQISSLDEIRAAVAPSSSPSSTSSAPRTAAPTSSEPAPRPMTFSEGRQMGAMSMGDATQRLANWGSRIASGIGTSWEQQGDQYVEMDQSGNILRSFPVGTAAGEEAFRQGNQRNQRLSLAAGVMGRYGAGEGVMGALGGTAARMAGPIGIGMAITDRVLDTVASQTEQGAQWRQIYGEEEGGRFGIKQRWGQAMAGYGGYFSGVGRERGQQAYQNMAGLGLRGEMLDNAVQFDQDMYLQHGMSGEQATQFVDMARNTGASLSELQKQISQVGEAAVAAGQNSEQAIARFASGVALLQTQVSNTSGSNQTAATVTSTMAANLPTGLNTDANQQALLGTLNQSNIMMVAAQTGQDPMALMNQIAMGDSSAQTSVIQGSLRMAVDLICKSAGTTREALAAEVKDLGGGLTPETMGQVLARHPQINPMTVGSIFQTFGIAFAPGDQMRMFFEEVTGGFDDLGKPGISGNPLDAAMAAMGGKGASRQEGGYSSLEPDQYGKDPLAAAMGIVTAGGLNSAEGYGDYKDWASKTGDRSLAAEALVSDDSGIESWAGVGLEGAKFQTSAGEKTWAQITRDPKLMAELDAGTMSVIGGGENKNDVKSVADLTGYSGAAAGGAPAGGGGFTLSLSPYAQRLFSVTGPSDAQQQGVPPVAYVNPMDFG